MSNVYQGISDFICDEIKKMRESLDQVELHRNILVDAISEIKAINDVDKNDKISLILDGCIDEVKKLKKGN